MLTSARDFVTGERTRRSRTGSRGGSAGRTLSGSAGASPALPVRVRKRPRGVGLSRCPLRSQRVVAGAPSRRGASRRRGSLVPRSRSPAGRGTRWGSSLCRLRRQRLRCGCVAWSVCGAGRVRAAVAVRGSRWGRSVRGLGFKRGRGSWGRSLVPRSRAAARAGGVEWAWGRRCVVGACVSVAVRGRTVSVTEAGVAGGAGGRGGLRSLTGALVPRAPVLGRSSLAALRARDRRVDGEVAVRVRCGGGGRDGGGAVSVRAALRT